MNNLLFSVGNVVSSSVSKLCIVAITTASVAGAVAVVAILLKPKHESFASSFRAFGEINGNNNQFRHCAKDFGVFSIVDSSFDVEKNENDSRITETNSITSVGFMNNWFHSDLRQTGTTIIPGKIKHKVI